LTEYKYTIYLYTESNYGTTGMFFPSEKEAIKHAEKLIAGNGCSYGVFVEYSEDGLYHRRLMWKDGDHVIRNYTKKLSSSAIIMLRFIEGFFSKFRRVPTYDEIKNEVQKRDYDVHRVLNILNDAGKIELSKPFLKNEPFKLKK
jgi:hypothetical protein